MRRKFLRETRWQRRDGTIIQVLLSSTPLDPNDLSTGVTFTALDITKRKQAQEALAQERNLLRTLVDSMPDLIYAKDTEGQYILKNKADIRTMGASSTGEVIGNEDIGGLVWLNKDAVIQCFWDIQNHF